MKKRSIEIIAIIAVPVLVLLFFIGKDNDNVGTEESTEITKTSETSEVTTEKPETENSINNEPLMHAATILESSFVHVKPGEYSEVYASIFTIPGKEVTGVIGGDGVIGSRTQTVVADEKGQARFVWKINQFGQYTVNVDLRGTQYTTWVDVK